MSRPFTYISSQMYYDLEIYFFRLAMYTDSEDYTGLPHHKRNQIDKEIIWMSSMLYLMQMFRVRPITETPVMAWKKKTKDGESIRIFRFSSNTTASRCLDVSASKVSAVARGERLSAGGYVFQFEEDYAEAVELDAETVGRKHQVYSKEFSNLFTKLTYK